LETPDKNHGSFKSTIGDVTNSEVIVGHGNVAGRGNTVGDRNIVAHKGGAAAGPGGAAAAGGSAAAAGRSSANVGLVERAKKSRVVKLAGVIALLATAAATGLLVSGATDLGVAGYIIAVIAVIVGVIPLFSNK
jgi:hypothetical protein